LYFFSISIPHFGRSLGHFRNLGPVCARNPGLCELMAKTKLDVRQPKWLQRQHTHTLVPRDTRACPHHPTAL
jgi:hypothetical protein